MALTISAVSTKALFAVTLPASTLIATRYAVILIRCGCWRILTLPMTGVVIGYGVFVHEAMSASTTLVSLAAIWCICRASYQAHTLIHGTVLTIIACSQSWWQRVHQQRSDGNG
ncbi:hypothetical protein THASP1DRAFT_21580 [Thamnocephalis sphaerospora]|uniref:Uncharacterized protein n=1 Tax=Thamnocephalis sphaerospora TaxID=78915 RepID=A0A4P9XYI0_9FUNG|nr:hypothetical protein THASP1DRAFT_21580 [Thamnocephalis sphaerospora]|eukprot:RKP10761.1 hypothetical protein THASP1DRAFT_21580 [Thamnocephalis sphaerospora]